MNAVKKIFSYAKHLNPFSKFIVKYGAVFIIALYTAAIVTYILAGRATDYYVMIGISSQLMQCMNPCIGILGLGALLFEAVSTPSKESSD